VTEHAIRVAGLVKRFDRTAALDGFDLEVMVGDLLTLLGPSGCGKTTALRVVAGFERPDAGTVEVAGRPVEGPGFHVPPDQRRVGMVFQDYALFPHMTVAGNVAYGVDAAARAQRVGEVLELVGLTGLERRLPHELSGGQQQRVALARALAPSPAVILLDEPFSNLDATLRQRVRRELKSILAEARATALFVTHDQEEALSVSDRVAVMRDGRIVQTAPPPELYRTPSDSWVAGFLGEADFLSGMARGGVVDTPVGPFATERTGPVTVMLRPEHVVLTPDTHGEAIVADREYFGHDQLVTVVLGGGERIRSRLGPKPDFRPGDRVAVKVEEVLTYPV
jgi:iron(III) transport system ATP-binding protein